MLFAVGFCRSAKMDGMKKSARITGKPRNIAAEQFGKKYRKGVSIRTIAQQSGRSYGFVHRVLVESGVQMREHGGPRRGQKRIGGRG